MGPDFWKILLFWTVRRLPFQRVSWKRPPFQGGFSSSHFRRSKHVTEETPPRGGRISCDQFSMKNPSPGSSDENLNHEWSNFSFLFKWVLWKLEETCGDHFGPFWVSSLTDRQIEIYRSCILICVCSSQEQIGMSHIQNVPNRLGPLETTLQSKTQNSEKILSRIITSLFLKGLAQK